MWDRAGMEGWGGGRRGLKGAEGIGQGYLEGLGEHAAETAVFDPGCHGKYVETGASIDEVGR